MFSEFSDILPYRTMERKIIFYKLFYILLFLSRYSFDSFDSFELFDFLPFPEMFQILPFPEMFRISPIDWKSRDIPEKFQAVRFSPTFRVGRGVRVLSLFVFVFFLYFFCILYFVFLHFAFLDIPGYSFEFFESFEFFDFHTFIFSFCLYIDIFPVFSPYYPLERYIIFLFCLHISNLSTIWKHPHILFLKK